MDITKNFKTVMGRDRLVISQVIIPQVMFLEPIYISRALNTEPASGRVTYFILRAYTGNHVLATANTGKIERGFGKMQVNGPSG